MRFWGRKSLGWHRGVFQRTGLIRSTKTKPINPESPQQEQSEASVSATDTEATGAVVKREGGREGGKEGREERGKKTHPN